MEELTIFSGSNLIHYGGLEVNENGSRHMFPRPSLVEEGSVGGVITYLAVDGRDLTVGLNPVLKAVELPARGSHLNPGLPNMN